MLIWLIMSTIIFSAGDAFAFLGLEGYSWNFFVLFGGPDDSPEFDKELGDYQEWKKYKESLTSKEEQELVDKLESQLKDKSNQQVYLKGHHRIVVVRLGAGEAILFPGGSISHATLVPKGQVRSMAVFHDLEPLLSTFCDLTKRKEIGLKKLLDTELTGGMQNVEFTKNVDVAQMLVKFRRSTGHYVTPSRLLGENLRPQQEQRKQSAEAKRQRMI